MYGYVYKTTNIINNKFYIGQHKYNKEELDPYYIGSGFLLEKAIKKHGRENFSCEILCFVENKKEADEKEKYYINYFKQLEGEDNSYNIALGGQGGKIHYEGDHRPPEDLEKTRATKAKQVHCNNGKECRVFFKDQIPPGWEIGQLLATPEEYNRRIQKGLKTRKGKKFFTNGIEEIFCKPEDAPEGYWRGVLRNTKHNEGKICINNGEHQKYIDPNDPLPEGYSYGGISRSPEVDRTKFATIKGRKWINNGEKEKYIFIDEPIPEGWKQGRLFHGRQSKKKLD